ncbi:MAG: M48 family metalloprotease [Pirellulales bacterium]|nr:M48 family metalloprotease [Pirellulales bacterium]
MPIVVTCTNCNRSFRVADSLAGRVAKCTCQARIVIPQPVAKQTATPSAVGTTARNAATAAANARTVEERILSGFQGSPGRPEISIGYRTMLGVTALGLALVPLEYCLVVAGATWLLVWQSTHVVFVSLQAAFSIGLIVAIVAMLRPIVFIFYRTKPVVRSARIPLESFPALATLIREISSRVGSPVPAKLAFSCEPNAAASYGNTLWQTLFSREFVLHLGLPLLGGRTVGQLSEVIAHELGHFSQPSATRLTCLHRWILSWLAAAATMPSGWTVENAARADSPLVRWFQLTAACGVAFAQAILIAIYQSVCLMVAVAIRQLEYDADRFGVAIAGPKVLEQNEIWLHEANRAFREARKLAAECLSRNCLPNDLPALTLDWLSQWDEEQRAAMHERLAREQTTWLSTHPAPRDRIMAARKTGAKGVFQCDLPATCLIPNYSGLCKATSREFYFNMLGSAPQGITFAPPAELFPYWIIYSSRKSSAIETNR